MPAFPGAGERHIAVTKHLYLNTCAVEAQSIGERQFSRRSDHSLEEPAKVNSFAWRKLGLRHETVVEVDAFGLHGLFARSAWSKHANPSVTGRAPCFGQQRANQSSLAVRHPLFGA